VSHAKGSAKHPLTGVTNAGCAVFGLCGKDCGVNGGGIFSVCKRGGDQRVERGLGRQGRECRRRLIMVTRRRVHVGSAIGMAVVSKRMTDGDAASVRYGVADVVSTSIGVVLACIDSRNHVLGVRTVIWLYNCRVCGRRGGENGRRVCQCMEISTLS
jgi:hypothetical protein